MKKILAILIVIYLVSLPYAALAGSGHEHMAKSCRCGTDLVHLGQNKMIVLMACGEPDRVFRLGENDQNENMRYAEDWIYLNLGGCVMNTFTFSGNELIKITWAKK